MPALAPAPSFEVWREAGGEALPWIGEVARSEPGRAGRGMEGGGVGRAVVGAFADLRTADCCDADLPRAMAAASGDSDSRLLYPIEPRSETMEFRETCCC
jgi:hypothetical protein